MRTFVSPAWIAVRRNRVAQYRRLRWLWAATLVAVLATGCRGVPVVADPPQPPEASRCIQGRTANLTPAPAYFWQLPEYLAEVVYTLAEERRLRGAEHRCLTDLKAKGVIR